MELILAKIYLILVFLILFVVAAFLIIQIRIKQNLEQNLTDIVDTIKGEVEQKAYQTQFKLGQIYLRKKLYSRAIQEFRSCFLKWDKNDRLGLASLLNTLGFTYYQLKEYEVAIYYYKTALNLTPDYVTSLTNLAYLYQQQGKLQELKETYEKLYLYDPNNKKTKELKKYLEKRKIKSE